MKNFIVAAIVAFGLGPVVTDAQGPGAPSLAEARGFIGSLRQKLYDQDPAVRRQAAEALGKIALDVEELTLVLAMKLEDHDPAVRLAASAALLDIGPAARRAVGPLTKALLGDEIEIRCNAATTLAQIGPLARSAFPALVKAAKDKNPRLRRYAVGAFASLGVPAKQVVPVLVEALSDPDEGEPGRTCGVWFNALSCLGALGTNASDATPALLTMVKSGGEKACAAMRALPKVSPTPETFALLKTFLHAKAFVMRRAAVYALGEAGPASVSAVPELLAALKVDDPTNEKDARLFKGCITWALGQIGPGAKDAVPALRREMEGSDKELATAAFVALKAVDPGGKDLLAVLKAGLKSDYQPTRLEAIRRLGELGPNAKDAVLDLALLLKEDSPLQRSTILGTLAKIGPAAQEAVPALRELAADRHYGRRALATLRVIEGSK
jgi:HEAT repeat protein